jgi:hypothetical protein
MLLPVAGWKPPQKVSANAAYNFSAREVYLTRRKKMIKPKNEMP